MLRWTTLDPDSTETGREISRWLGGGGLGYTLLGASDWQLNVLPLKSCMTCSTCLLWRGWVPVSISDGRAEHKGRPYGFKKDETEWLKPAAVVTMNPITHSPNTRQKLRQLAAVFRNKKPRDKERAFKAHTNKSLYCLLCNHWHVLNFRLYNHV